MSFDFVIAGVGGQPIDRMVELFACACEAAGVEFVSTSPRGVLVLGGSRLAQLSVGECWSAIVTEDTGGLLVGLEVGEALRWAKYCARDGTAIVDALALPPEGAAGPGAYPAPAAVEAALREVIANVYVEDMRALAHRSSTDPESAYAFLVGASSRLQGLDNIEDGWEKGLKRANASDREAKAFAAGALWGREKKLERPLR